MTTENVQYWKDAHALLLDQNKKLKGYIKQIKEDGGAIIASLGDELEAEFLAPLRAENEKLKKEVKTRKSLCDHFENLNKKNFEENKELKEDISVMHGDDEVQELNDEIAELKAEIKKLKERVELYAEHNKKLNSDMDESEKHDWKKKYHHLNTRFIALENIEKQLKEKSLHMQNYLETREVKYCEKDGCGRYCDEFADEISKNYETCEWICKECQEDN